ncbi:unnamed protein product [Acanthoscelides obtectus]|uniref:Nuclear pore complex protein Nup88 n=1 Tax=Acanthoscelides obtectus TaxID=200917 RepID=A0A9P0L525_ACAOB|nr:unnamed protein product [Acanthoscelides obtectus]CAK1662203.1 Nuclear pore complex protein Nup88 [Acanthoscelides obtectus]
MKHFANLVAVVFPKYFINAKTQTIDRIIAKSFPERKKVKEGWEILQWPIYILRGDMTVYYMYINLNSRSLAPLKGPIPLSLFEAKENEACSLICLNTNPQIICIALSSGTICHGVILKIDEELQEQLKTSAQSLNKVPSKEIMSFETVELELGLKTSDEDIEIKPHKFPIFLYRDECKPGRYFATHSAGVHMVTINCVDGLQAFASSESDDVDPPPDLLEEPSKAEYLVCTKTASLEKVNPVIGFSIYYKPASIMVLLADGSFITLELLYTPILPAMGDGSNSSLKELLKEPFDQYIQNILKKASSQPVLKLPAGGEQNLEQSYEILKRTAKVFREEYLKQHTKAREELEKRVETLTLIKKNQQAELKKIEKEKEQLHKNASLLTEKYEDIKIKQNEIHRRCERLLMLISKKRNKPTGAEQAFIKDYQEISEKISKYFDRIGKFKQRMRYQEVQMQNWKSPEVKKVSSINVTTKTIADMMQEVKDIMERFNLSPV